MKKLSIIFELTACLEFDLGIVTKCTLPESLKRRGESKWHTVKNFTVDGRSYCVVDYGNPYRHYHAVHVCKNLNARLPLPRNKKEADEFLKISGGEYNQKYFNLKYFNIPGTIDEFKGLTHVDARNPKKTANKAEWVDAENKPLGDRPVYPRGHTFCSKS